LWFPVPGKAKKTEKKPRNPSNMGDSFLRVLHSLVSGARQAEEFAQVLVGAAVEDALLCVARDYGHEYAGLLRRYKAELVQRHASGAVGDRTRCGGLTKGGKPCGKAAVLHGFCQRHAETVAEEASKRRRVEAYKASVATQAPERRLARELLGGDCPGAGGEFAFESSDLQSSLRAMCEAF
jgi:hypothetical protein